MQASVVNVLQLNAEKARPPLPFIAIEALLMLLPFAYLQMRTSSFFRYTFSSHYLEFHISIFRRNIFTMHRAYNVDSTTYAYVRVATSTTRPAIRCIRSGNIRLRASCDPLSDRFRYQVTLRFICVWTSVQNGFSNSVSVSRRRTRTGHCSLRHFLPPCFAFEVWGFGRLGHALPL